MVRNDDRIRTELGMAIEQAPFRDLGDVSGEQQAM